MIQFEQAISYFQHVFYRHTDVNCWVAGGAVADYFMFGYIKGDIDVWFSCQEDFEKAIKVFELIQPEHHIIDNVHTFKVGKYAIQLIGRYFYPDAQSCINSFDFTVCCGAVTRDKVITNESFFVDLTGRRLVINGDKLSHPLNTLRRMQKYIKKGFTICNGGLLTIAQNLQTTDLNNPEQNVLAFYPDGKPRFARID